MQPFTQTVFSGIDKHSPPPADGDVPALFADAEAEANFRDVIADVRDRFGARGVTPGYFDTEAKEWVAVPRHLAVVNPAWLGDGRADAPQDDAAWTFTTGSYSPTDAMDAYGPLTAMAHKTGHTDAFGRVTTYRNGGEIHVEVFFTDITAGVESATGDRFVLGFESGTDHFTRSSIWARVIAYDTENGSIHRHLSDKFTTPHRGAAKDRTAAWWETTLDRVEKLADTFYEVVAEARNYTVDLSTVPVDVEQFYEGLDFPGTYPQLAAERLPPAREYTAWQLYEAMAHVLTHEYDGKLGGHGLTNHAATLNTLLYNPPTAERQALRARRDDLIGQASLDKAEENAAAVLHERLGSLDDAVSSFTNFREKVRTMLNDMDAAAEAEA